MTALDCGIFRAGPFVQETVFILRLLPIKSISLLLKIAPHFVRVIDGALFNFVYSCVLRIHFR